MMRLSAPVLSCLLATAVFTGCKTTGQVGSGLKNDTDGSRNVTNVIVDESMNGKSVFVKTGQDIVVKLRTIPNPQYQWQAASNESLGDPSKTSEAPPAGSPPGDWGFDLFTWTTDGVSQFRIVQSRIYS